MTKQQTQEQIKREIELLRPYAVAHQIYFQKIALKPSHYRKVLKGIAKTKVCEEKFYHEYIGFYFDCDIKTTPIKTLALEFQEILNYLAHRIFKNDPVYQPLTQEQLVKSKI